MPLKMAVWPIPTTPPLMGTPPVFSPPQWAATGESVLCSKGGQSAAPCKCQCFLLLAHLAQVAHNCAPTASRGLRFDHAIFKNAFRSAVY